MGIQDQTGIINLNPPSVPSNQMQVDVRTSSANGGGKHILKVRKPYTITKQREKWAEEEHKKFLEALQLYGRAWRRIEEHIGTKTAVQIRSHAQKFFSKVVRESAADSTDNNMKPIEIPPPRPKRKPTHPYPRKLGNSCSNLGLSISKLERSFSPAKSAFEGENGSPTSVLSGLGSDTLGSLLSNLQNSCTSPVTSAAGSNEQETLVEEENNLPLSRQTSAGLTTHDESAMELDMSSNGNVPSKEASLLEEQVPCLKLFGKTVMMTDKHKPSSPGAGNTTQDPNSLPTLSIGLQERSAPSQNFVQGSSIHGDLPLGLGKSAWSPWSGSVLPMFYSLPSREIANPAEARTIPLPWWGMNQEEITRQVTSRPLAEAPSDKEGQKECSWAGSDTSTSVSDGAKTVCSQSAANAIQSERAGSGTSARGFVPYRRCVVGKEVQQNSRRTAEDGEGQSVGLCL